LNSNQKIPGVSEIIFNEKFKENQKNTINTNKVISKEDAYNIQYQYLITEIEIGNLNTKVQIGEFIFELAEILYGDYAPKITGMILEWDIEYLKHLIIFEPLNLKQIITDGFELLKSHNL
jgi:hypothetical protein